MMHAINFDVEKHEYSINGQVKPSVTQILRGVNLSPRFDGVSDVDMTWYMDRGTMVHKAMHHICDWTVKEANKDNPMPGDKAGKFLHDYIQLQDDIIKGYLISGMHFLGGALLSPVPFITELPVYCESQDYCGTIDLIATVEFEGERHEAIIDWKCGQPQQTTAFQLAGYALAYSKDKHHDLLRLAVHLDKKGGEPRILPYRQQGDFQVFKSARYLYSKLDELNLIKKEKS
tara:strand:- start:1438 stop:2130 length:693 start_codon:yes stop_codon:yes gene_type:complete